jgi:hypothetical protein
LRYERQLHEGLALLIDFPCQQAQVATIPRWVEGRLVTTYFYDTKMPSHDSANERLLTFKREKGFQSIVPRLIVGNWAPESVLKRCGHNNMCEKANDP